MQRPRSNVTRHCKPKPSCCQKAASWSPSRHPAQCVRAWPRRWQVSWLAGRCFAPPSRFPSGTLALSSPLTVAGAAAASGPF